MLVIIVVIFSLAHHRKVERLNNVVSGDIKFGYDHLCGVEKLINHITV